MPDTTENTVDKNLVELAEEAFFNGLKSDRVPPAGYAYREGKTWADCKAAIRKGLWDGAGKFEHEMECAARELAKVFRSVAKKKP